MCEQKLVALCLKCKGETHYVEKLVRENAALPAYRLECRSCGYSFKRVEKRPRGREIDLLLTSLEDEVDEMDLARIRERKNEPLIPHEEVRKSLGLEEGENNEKRTTNENVHSQPGSGYLGGRAEGSAETPPAEGVLEDAKPCETRQGDSEESVRKTESIQ